MRAAASIDRRLALAAGVSACLTTWPARVHAAESGVTNSEVVIGQSVTLQGGRDSYGASALKGVKAYFDALNAAGGVNGRRLVLRTLDDDNKNSQAEANARKLVEEGAFLLFAPVEGGASTAVAKVASELKVPLFGPMAGPPGLRRPHLPMVFPVRAEHRDEFRALLTWGQRVGLKTVAFFHVDSDTGRLHLENVRLIAKELGMEVVLPLPFKSDASDAQVDELARTLLAKAPDLVINHGSARLYQRLLATARPANKRMVFMGVNSGSSQIAKSLGPLARGMVFSQVVPSPWERKREITREYQEAMRKAEQQEDFSYGSLEGFVTAKALGLSLRAAGKDLTRASLIKALENASFDLGGMKVRYAPGDHEGSRFVDLSIVNAEGRFIH